MRNFTIMSLLVGMFQISYSQTSESVKLKIDSETQCQIRYHYFPNLEAYFDFTTNSYLYNNKGQWISADEIPKGYRGYSLYNKTNFPITDYDDDNVMQYLQVHKKKYPYNNGKKSRELTALVH